MAFLEVNDWFRRCPTDSQNVNQSKSVLGKDLQSIYSTGSTGSAPYRAEQ